MERRKFPRQDVRGVGLKATVVLNGGSLIRENSPATVEIAAQPMNLSRSGICLSLGLDASWATISPQKEVTLSLEKGEECARVKGRVVHLRGGHHLLGVEFLSPLERFHRFLMPEELLQ